MLLKKPKPLPTTGDDIVTDVPMRVVDIFCVMCCGCGCYPVGLKYRVPVDSPIKDGDTVSRSQIDEQFVIE